MGARGLKTPAAVGQNSGPRGEVGYGAARSEQFMMGVLAKIKQPLVRSGQR